MMTTAPGITTYTTLCTHITTTLPSLAYPTTIDIPDVSIVMDDEEEDLLMDHPTKATKIQGLGTTLGSIQPQSKENDEQPIQVIYKESEHKDTPEQPTYNDEKQEHLK
jgi:hypothetical protein